MAGSFDALIDGIVASFDFTMGDASGHLTERIGAHNTAAETALGYGQPGLPEVPYTAVSFDGTTSFATAASNAAFDFADGPFTVIWIGTVTDLAANRIPVDRGHATGNAWMLIRKTTNVWAFADSSAGTVIVSAPANTDAVGVHVIGFDKNGATAHMYRDGTDVTVAGTNVTLTNSTGSLFIGEQAAFAFHKGVTYRLIGFASVLTPAQHSAVARAALAPGYGYRPVPRASRLVGRAALTRRYRPRPGAPDTAVAAAATNAPAGLASGTGSAFDATVIVAPGPSAATGTGAASAPTASVAPNAAAGTGTGAALAPTASIAPAPGVAAGTGSAPTPTPRVAPNAGIGSGTGIANNPAVSVAPTAGVAAGTGAANAPTPSIFVYPGVAPGTGAALDPTVSTASATNAPAGVAAGTGVANAPTASVAASAGLASGTGAAFSPTIKVTPNAGVASGTGIARTPAASIAVWPGAATGAGAAYDPVAGQQVLFVGGAAPSGSAFAGGPTGIAVAGAPSGSAISSAPSGSATHPH